MDKGWIKLHRKLVDWEWYHDTNTMRVFLHFLLTVNYQDKKWRGILIKKGQLVTSRRTLEKRLNISQQSIRTSLANLLLTHEITLKPTHRFSIITLIKWADYQGSVEKSTHELTHELTTTKEVKKKRNKPAKAGVNLKSIKTMKKYEEKTIDYDTGETRKSFNTGKLPKNKEAIKLAQMFDKMASKFSKRPIATPKSYFIVINAMNKPHNLTYDGIEKLFKDWFDSEKVKPEDKVKLAFALSASNINAFKVLN